MQFCPTWPVFPPLVCLKKCNNNTNTNTNTKLKNKNEDKANTTMNKPRTKLIMLDNYDSFTYNIVQYLGELGADVVVFRNDEITLHELLAQDFDRLVVSPGPCAPAQAGISVAAIQALMGKKPILGVCLGHQAMGEALGGKVVRAKTLMHGKTSIITNTQTGIFANLPVQFTVNRYHSLAIERSSCPPELEITAWTDDGEIMGMRHRHLPFAMRMEGVQFHPESILTEHGHAMLNNFLL